MKLIDLSREIHHKMARLPNHPMVIIAPFSTHEEKRIADGYEFSSAVMSLNMGDHSGTHVDAPVHFDQRPGAAAPWRAAGSREFRLMTARLASARRA